MGKFIEEVYTDEWEVFTPDGWKDFSGIAKTIEYDEYEVVTENGKKIICADTHILIDEFGQEIFTQDVIVNQTKIQTLHGNEIVTDVIDLKRKSHMYDLMNVDGSLYYTNDIVSHNTTLLALYICYYALFNSNKLIAIAANRESTAVEMLDRIKLAYENLPKWLQQGVIKWNRKQIVLENGTIIIAASANSNALRGRALNLLVIDEVAFVLPKVWREFYSATYPALSADPDAKMIFISTENGMNHFYDFWNNAVTGKNGFGYIRVMWNEVVMPNTNPPRLRDEAWKKDQLRSMSPKEFAQEFGGEFIASGDTLINGEVLGEILPYPDESKLDTHFDCEKYGIMDFTYQEQLLLSHLSLYSMPIPGRKYSFGVDSARVTEKSDGDNFALQIIDITEAPYLQIGSLSLKIGVHYMEIPAFLAKLGRIFNNAYIFIENNEAAGQEIANTLFEDYGYENTYNEKIDYSGFRTTLSSKRKGCLNLKALIENKKLTIVDYETVHQLSVFNKHKSSYAASPGESDDSVMALVAAIYFMQDPQFFDDKVTFISNIGRGTINTTKDKIKVFMDDEEDDLPSFFFTNGLNNIKNEVTDTSWLIR